jgi:hypothetical protein
VSSRGIPGTAGALAHTLHDGRRVLLTTWHVLFGSDGVDDGPVSFVDDGRLSPAGRALYGKIGTIRIGDEDVHVDCAVAAYDGERRCTPREHTAARAGDRVTKSGAATGTTEGVVIRVDASDDVTIDGRVLRTSRQILVRSLDGSPFSAPGDSGALLLDADQRAVGLLWGVNTRGEGVACPIAPVLYAMNITLGADGRR